MGTGSNVAYPPGVVVLLLLLYPGLVLFLPGYLASRWLWSVASPLTRVATSLGLGVATVVPTAYVLPFILRTPLTPWWSLGASIAVSVGFGVLLHRRGDLRTPAAPHRDWAPSEARWVAGVLVVLCAASALTTLPRWYEATNVWAPCPHQAAMYLMDNGGFGLRAYDPAWDGYVSHLLERGLEPAFGLRPVLERQRIGSAATLVHAFLFHGSGGLPVAAFVYTALNVLLGAALMARHVRRPIVLLLLSACYLAGVRYAAFYMVNESALAGGLAALALYLLTDERASIRSHALMLAGAAVSLAIATRPYALTLLPAAIWLVGRKPNELVRFGFVVVVALFPWALTQAEAFGSPFHHPSLMHANTVVEFLGFKFSFHPLNYPFADTLLRPADAPLPNLFSVPLESLQGFGAPFVILAVAGLTRLSWQRTLGALLWGAPAALLLMSIVWLDHDKRSYILMSYAPVALFAGAGTRWIVDAVASTAQNRSFDWRGAALPLGFTAAVSLTLLVVLPIAARSLTFQVDSRRQYHDGPNRWERTPMDARLGEMTSIGLLPAFDGIGDLSWGFETTRHLVANARPAQRGDEVSEDPVLFWAETLPLDIDVAIRVQDTPRLPRYAIDPNTALGPVVEDYMAVSLQVPGVGNAAQVHFYRVAGDLEVRVTTDQSGEPGYITLGLIAAGSAGLSKIVITINDVPQTLEYHLASERDGGERYLRAIANHPLGYAPAAGSLIWTTDATFPERCTPHPDEPELTLGPNVAEWHEMRIWRSLRWPADPPTRCANESTRGASGGPDR